MGICAVPADSDWRDCVELHTCLVSLAGPISNGSPSIAQSADRAEAQEAAWIPLGAGMSIKEAVRPLSDRHLQIPGRTGWMRRCR